MRRAVCLFLAAILLLGTTSCKKSKAVLSEVKTISEERTWWDVKIAEITPDEITKVIGEKPYSMPSQYYAADADSVVLSFHVISEEMNGFNILRRYSYSGEMLGQVLLNDCFDSEEDYSAPGVIYQLNGKYYCFINHFDAEVGSFVESKYEIDFEEGKLKDPTPIDRPEAKGDQLSLDSVAVVSDKLVYLWRMYDGESFSYLIRVNDGNGIRESAPMFGNGVRLEYINDFISDGNGVAFFAEVIDNGQAKNLYCKMDLDTFALTNTQDQYNLLYADKVPGCGIFDMSDNRSIRKVDVTSGNKDTVVELADTSILGEMLNTHVVWARDDRVVLFDENQQNGLASPRITVLSKAEKNPHAGKKVLQLAYLHDLQDEDYAAVNAFNLESDKYFVELDHKYYDMQNPENTDPDKERDYKLTDVFHADAITTLMSDIRDGNGPDMVLYSNEEAQLNSTEYLIDLTSRIKSEKSLQSGEYMDFIQQPNGRDGKHYRLDYYFVSECFLVDKRFLDEGTQGLTYAQYDDLILEHHDDIGVLFDEDLPLLKTLLSHSDCFSFNEEGKISLGSGEFRKAAEYIASVPEAMKNEIFTGYPVDGIEFVGYMSFGLFFECCRKYYDNYSIIGLPSSTGHAETITGNGIGITSCSPLQDGAWEFVMKLLSPDIQSQFLYIDPVLKSALRTSAENLLNAYNSDPDPYGYSDGPISNEIIDRYIEQISDAILVPDLDSSIIVIINEEMPAYFEGHKSLDDVIGIIENRVNLMITERKATE